MRGTEAVEIGSPSTAEYSRRLLSAIRSRSFDRLTRELALATRICRTPLPGCAKSTLAEEQAELLGAIVEDIPISGYAAAEISLLSHLADG